MTSITAPLTREARRDRVRTLIGRKTPSEIRDWSTQDPDRDWGFTIADRLERAGYLSLADVTDDEFDEIIA